MKQQIKITLSLDGDKLNAAVEFKPALPSSKGWENLSLERQALSNIGSQIADAAIKAMEKA